MKTILLTLALCTLLPCPAILRADTLAGLAAATGTEWMIGSWATEDGGATLTYSWKLDKHAIGVAFKMGDRESEGMIVRQPGPDDVVVYAAADNTGGMTKGKWIDYMGHPTLISRTTTADGTERTMAVSHEKAGADTMIVTLYAVGADGEPDATQSREVTFKRQK